jgi:hypothetical protein
MLPFVKRNVLLLTHRKKPTALSVRKVLTVTEHHPKPRMFVVGFPSQETAMKISHDIDLAEPKMYIDRNTDSVCIGKMTFTEPEKQHVPPVDIVLNAKLVFSKVPKFMWEENELNHQQQQLQEMVEFIKLQEMVEFIKLDHDEFLNIPLCKNIGVAMIDQLIEDNDVSLTYAVHIIDAAEDYDAFRTTLETLLQMEDM